MGVVNVTPDSFSDGGRWLRPSAAVEQGLRLVAEGADIIDVGGESTRPGARRTSFEDEIRRVVPVVRALADAGAVVSVDTMRAAVADLAIRAGARIVNDVSGGQADSGMFRVVAEAQVPYVVMHWRGHSDVMQRRASYDQVVDDVSAELRARLDAAQAAGVRPGQLVIDPGLGFAKTAAQSWQLLAHLPRLRSLGVPVLVGASRKSFLADLAASTDTNGQRSAAERDDATAAVTALAAAAGAWCVRVHAVKASAEAVRVAARWRDAHADESLVRAPAGSATRLATTATQGDMTTLEGW
jgi:dihydropteroate synthase